MDYEQYLLIMILFFTSEDDLYKRIGDLIELNVNAVLLEIGEEGNMTGSQKKFSLNNSYTAIDVACSFEMDFLVMPDSFVKRMVDESKKEEVTQFGNNRYNFTVSRGY